MLSIRRIALMALFAAFFIDAAEASCVSSGGVTLCGTASYPSGTNVMAGNGTHFYAGGYDSESTSFHYLDTAFQINSSCQSVLVGPFYGLDLQDNLLISWYFRTPPSFPGDPSKGMSVARRRPDCSIYDFFYLSNSQTRKSFGSNDTRFYSMMIGGMVEVYDKATLLSRAGQNPGTTTQPLYTCPPISSMKDIHVNPDGSYWSLGNNLSLHNADCTIRSSFNLSGNGVTGEGKKLWLSNYTAVYEYLIKPETMPVSISAYPDKTSFPLYFNHTHFLKLLVSGASDVLVYPVFDNYTRIPYTSINDGLQIVWGSHDDKGYHLTEDKFLGGKAFAYFTIISHDSSGTIPVRFVAKNISNNQIVAEQLISFTTLPVPQDHTPLYFERFHPEDHTLGTVNVTPPSLSFQYNNTSLAVYLNSTRISTITGDVDDLQDELVYGPHEAPQYRSVFYHKDDDIGEESWVVRLWFGWFADGSDVAPDQFPDMEMFDIWVDKTTMKPEYIQSFVHFGSWWFRPIGNESIVIGDKAHLFVDPRTLPESETHTPSPNEHGGLYYGPWLPFIGPLHHIDPTNSQYHTDVIHTAGSENTFGFFEKPRSSINTYLTVAPYIEQKSPTSYYVAPDTELDVIVSVVNDGSVHDTIAGLEPEVTLTATRTAFLPGRFPADIDATIGNQLGPVTSYPLLNTDAPAGKGTKTVFRINSTELFIPVPDVLQPPQITSIFAKAKVGNLTDVDYAILVPKYLNGSASVNNFMGSIKQLKTDFHSFFIERGAYPAALILYLNWFGSDLDLSITDPNGRKIGFNRTTGNLTSEITGANYSGPSSQPEMILIPNATDGNWTIEVFAVEVNDSEPYVVSATVINMTEEAPPTTTLPPPPLNLALPTISSGGGGGGAGLAAPKIAKNDTNNTKQTSTAGGSGESTQNTESLTDQTESDTQVSAESPNSQTPTGSFLSNLPGITVIIAALLAFAAIFFAFRRFF